MQSSHPPADDIHPKRRHRVSSQILSISVLQLLKPGANPVSRGCMQPCKESLHRERERESGYDYFWKFSKRVRKGDACFPRRNFLIIEILLDLHRNHLDFRANELDTITEIVASNYFCLLSATVVSDRCIRSAQQLYSESRLVGHYGSKVLFERFLFF